MLDLSYACLGAALCTATMLTQVSPDLTDVNEDSSNATATAPVAWVYVSSAIGDSGKSQVFAFDAASNGKLTPIAGPPFDDSVSWMAVNGKYLFGSAVGAA